MGCQERSRPLSVDAHDCPFKESVWVCRGITDCPLDLDQSGLGDGEVEKDVEQSDGEREEEGHVGLRYGRMFKIQHQFVQSIQDQYLCRSTTITIIKPRSKQSEVCMRNESRA